jgi:hypothetical protein
LQLNTGTFTSSTQYLTPACSSNVNLEVISQKDPSYGLTELFFL